MSKDNLVCPKCDEPLEVDQEWRLTDMSLVGTTVGTTEEMQGYYAHKECLERRELNEVKTMLESEEFDP